MCALSAQKKELDQQVNQHIAAKQRHIDESAKRDRQACLERTALRDMFSKLIEQDEARKASADAYPEVDRILRPGNTHFDVLGLPINPEPDAANRAYRRLVGKVHPDKCRSPYAADAFHRLKEARDVLSDDQARAAYLGALHADTFVKSRWTAQCDRKMADANAAAEYVKLGQALHQHASHVSERVQGQADRLMQMERQESALFERYNGTVKQLASISQRKDEAQAKAQAMYESWLEGFRKKILEARQQTCRLLMCSLSLRSHIQNPEYLDTVRTAVARKEIQLWRRTTTSVHERGNEALPAGPTGVHSYVEEIIKMVPRNVQAVQQKFLENEALADEARRKALAAKKEADEAQRREGEVSRVLSRLIAEVEKVHSQPQPLRERSRGAADQHRAEPRPGRTSALSECSEFGGSSRSVSPQGVFYHAESDEVEYEVEAVEIGDEPDQSSSTRPPAAERYLYDLNASSDDEPWESAGQHGRGAVPEPARGPAGSGGGGGGGQAGSGGGGGGACASAVAHAPSTSAAGAAAAACQPVGAARGALPAADAAPASLPVAGASAAKAMAAPPPKSKFDDVAEAKAAIRGAKAKVAAAKKAGLVEVERAHGLHVNQAVLVYWRAAPLPAVVASLRTYHAKPVKVVFDQSNGWAWVPRVQVIKMPHADWSGLPAFLRPDRFIEALDLRSAPEGHADDTARWYHAKLIAGHASRERGTAALRLWVEYSESGQGDWLRFHQVRPVEAERHWSYVPERDDRGAASASAGSGDADVAHEEAAAGGADGESGRRTPLRSTPTPDEWAEALGVLEGRENAEVDGVVDGEAERVMDADAGAGGGADGGALEGTEAVEGAGAVESCASAAYLGNGHPLRAGVAWGGRSGPAGGRVSMAYESDDDDDDDGVEDEIDDEFDQNGVEDEVVDGFDIREAAGDASVHHRGQKRPRDDSEPEAACR